MSSPRGLELGLLFQHSLFEFLYMLRPTLSEGCLSITITLFSLFEGRIDLFHQLISIIEYGAQEHTSLRPPLDFFAGLSRSVEVSLDSIGEVASSEPLCVLYDAI